MNIIIKLTVKYVLWIAAVVVVSRLTAVFINQVLPELLTHTDGSETQRFPLYFIEFPVNILGNILIAMQMKKDMAKVGFNSSALLLLTCMNSVIGFIFFIILFFGHQYQPQKSNI